MDYFFKIPRWLFASVLTTAIVFLALLIYVEASLSYTDELNSFMDWVINNADIIISLATLTTIFTFCWLTAAVVKYVQDRKKSWLLLVPFLPALLFQGIVSVFIIDTVTINLILPTSFSDRLGTMIISGELDAVIYTGLATSTIALPISAFAIVQLLKSKPIDWIRIPLLLITLPIGILWLQPSLRATTVRKNIDRPEDHFIE